MKKVFTIILFFYLVFPEYSFGQITNSISAGVNFSNIKSVNVDFNSAQSLNYFIGVAPEFWLNDKTRFTVDLQYSVKGFSVASSNGKHKYDYLDILPEIEYDLFNFLSIAAGLNYGIKISEQRKIGSQEWSKRNELSLFKSTDAGVTGKVKVHYQNLFIFGRYNLGMINVSTFTFTNDVGETIDNAKLLNRNMQVGMGYRF